MKRPLILPLAIALALGGTHALALGLGPVHVKSKLNQPLDAEIPVIQGSAGEAEGLLVNLAAAEDFDRVGINRARLTVPLEFSLVKGANGSMVIKVTSKEAVRDSYLDFLVEANWPKGRLLREYTVLLDPPLMAPASHAAATAAVAATPRTQTLTTRETTHAKTQAAAPAPAPEHVPAKTAPVAPPTKVAAGQYGPVAAGETLSGIAREAMPGTGANLDQMMLALLKNNPAAFYKSNINALKRGAILRVPSADEIKAAGSASEAAAQVRAQIEDWRGNRASPTLVAENAAKAAPTPVEKAAKPAAATATAKTPGERLELVPPKAGKGSLAMADRPGSGAGNAAATAELKAELARAKESLTTRDQETGELKSRVKELEDLKNKNDRLIGLKNSEIADLQQRLKQIQDKAAATPAAPAKAPNAPASTAPVAATATPTQAPAKPGGVAKLDKADIWGDAGTTSPKSIPPEPTKAPPVAATTESKPGSPVAGTSAAPAIATANAPAAAKPTSPATTPAVASSGATTTPLAPTPATTPLPPASTVKKPVLPHAQPQPASAEAWYDAAWVKPAALGAGVLLLLAGLLGMRKRKAVPVAGARGSIADAFGASPLEGNGGGFASAEAEEAQLHEHLQLDPSNLGLHLELLSLYYAERDVAKFEDAAADMHAQVTDPHEPEWLEAQAMGQELVPNNPLFAGAAHYDAADAASATAHAVTAPSAALRHADVDDAASDLRAAAAAPARAPAHHDHDADTHFGIEHPAAPFATPGMPTEEAREGDSFNFDDLPPLQLHPAATPATAAHVVPDLDDPGTHVSATLDDDFFASEDAVGTKLDLARAYMDMGDPDGARSMLEEVLAEGNETQKAEANRLMADIH